ncbi:MAG: GTPase HflX [Candidatus Izemoplasmatales bacterium]
MEKAILVGLETNASIEFDYHMKELSALAEACDLQVLETFTQRLDGPTAALYIGSGKAEEIKSAVTTLGADVVVFDDELSPTHIRNLEKALTAKVIDRTILILDIFASRARTKEAMLQVELAQSQYMLPRTVGMYSSLSRQSGGIGSKGPGETKLELDKRILRDRIAHIQEELKEIVSVRRTQREKRKKDDIPTVALTGYTNSGKSTILNKMLEYSTSNTEKYVFMKDMLFATLETATRNVELGNKHQFLVTDTVGFISKLPHHLVEAFKSTLEEIKEASLILHIVDGSNPKAANQAAIVDEVLRSLEVKNIPIIYVINKSDLISDAPSLPLNPRLTISAKTGDGFDRLVQKIDDQLYSNNVIVTLFLPYDKGQIYSFLKDHANIIQTDYENEGMVVKADLNERLIGIYKQYIR